MKQSVHYWRLFIHSLTTRPPDATSENCDDVDNDNDQGEKNKVRLTLKALIRFINQVMNMYQIPYVK